VLFVLFTDIVKVTKQRELHWATYVTRTEKIGNASEVVVGELEGKRPWVPRVGDGLLLKCIVEK
jgi:hypothetical protein